jgi:hypothetical protein
VSDADAPAGARFVLASSAVFLLPLATAIAGACAAGSRRAAQPLGALIGLAVGMALAMGLVRLLRPAGSAKA